jgi:hypothetical protein
MKLIIKKYGLYIPNMPGGLMQLVSQGQQNIILN